MPAVFVWAEQNPLPVVLLALGLAVANLWRKRRESRRRLLAVTVPYVVLTVLSIPAVVDCARGILEWQYPPTDERPEGTQAIVVLGAGMQPDDETPGGLALDDHARSRCRRAAELYRQGLPCPVVACGGRAGDGASGPSRAAAMRKFLITLGVAAADIDGEDKSQSTYENAVECRRLLAGRGLHRVVVVTDAGHLVRAVACFRKQGLIADGRGCDYLSTPANKGRRVYWPHPRALGRWQPIWHEWLGLGWYWLTGKI